MKSTFSGLTERNTMFWHIAVTLIVVAWGVSFVATKVLMEEGLSPTEAYVYRFILAYLIMLIFCHDRFRSNSARDELLFLSCGMCAGSIYYIAENTALEYTLAANVSLITTMSPLLTMLLLAALYRNERPTRGMVMGSIVAFLGVGCVIFNSSFVLQVNPIGDLLSFAAALSFAVYCIILRKLNAFYTASFITRKTFFYGVLTALPFYFMQPGHAPLEAFTSVGLWINMLFLAIVCSWLGFVVWAICVKRLGAITTNNYLYFQPVATLVAAALILGEQVSLIGYIGCALILLGVWISDRATHRKV